MCFRVFFWGGGRTDGFQRKNWEGVKEFIFVVKCGVAH